MKAILAAIESVLKKLFPTRVGFDDGSWIEFLNREAILYSEENGHRMEIVWYFQAFPKKGRLLRISDINHWDPPYDLERLSQDKKNEIQQKVIRYCNARNIELAVVLE